MADLKRLGKRGSYRLGRLRAQGIGEALPPAPFRPWFQRPRHAGIGAAWLLGFFAGIAVIVAGAWFGLWFLPFVVGVVAGLADRFGNWGGRIMLPAVAAMAVVGWAIPLCWSALHGEPLAATARVVAALAGLPPYAALAITLTLLVAVIQAAVGLWLGRALTPRRPEL
jgi:hypothetical protein